MKKLHLPGAMLKTHFHSTLSCFFQNCKIYLVGTKKDIVDDNPNLRDVDVQTAEPLAAGKSI